MRIAFFLRHPFHEAILRPVADLLSQDHQCQVFKTETRPTADDPFSMASLRACIGDMVRFRPHVILSGEDIGPLRLRYYFPATLFVHTRHGLASKGIAYRSVRDTDYVCVTSPFMRDWYLEANARPRREFWIVGYVQMDPLFRSEPFPRPFGIPDNRKIVLYAPTFQKSLSSAPMLGERAIELLRGNRTDVAVIIKPHPLIKNFLPEWMEVWRALVTRHPNVYLVEDTHSDVMPFLRAADVLVSDASSVLLEFLALNRPMVLITSPHRFEERYFDPNGLEWRWRDMGQEIEDVGLLPGAVARALDNPSLGAEKRSDYRARLFGDLTDGRSRERLAEKVNGLAALAPQEQKLRLGYYVGSSILRLVCAKQRIAIWNYHLPLRLNRSAP